MQLPADFGVMPIIRSTIRYGAAALLAGFVLCGPAGHHPFQIEELGSFSAAAAADSHAQGSNPWSATSIPTVAQHHRRRWGQHPQKDQNRLGIGPEGHQVAVSFDAEKRAVQVHVPLNGKGDFETHPSYRTGWSFLQPLHSERENRQLFGRAHFESVERAISERSTPSELLNKEVLPTESRFKHALTIAPEDGTSVMAKTKLGIAGLSFAPFEILGVNLDPKSLERAEALGFKVDKQSETPAWRSAARYPAPNASQYRCHPRSRNSQQGVTGSSVRTQQGLPALPRLNEPRCRPSKTRRRTVFSECLSARTLLFTPAHPVGGTPRRVRQGVANRCHRYRNRYRSSRLQRAPHSSR